jgi:plasmid maintenance system antidote protein VapI
MTQTPARALKQLVASHATKKAAAAALGISAPHLQDLLHGRRGFSAAMLAKLGLEPVTTFRRKRTA